MRRIDLVEAELAIHEWGDRRAPTFVFWHALGLDASGRMLDEVAPRIAAHGFHVVAVDGPGFGDSPGLPADGYRVAALAGLVHRLVATLDLEPIVFMGHSWGGAIAVRYAEQHPDQVRALVLLDSGHIDYADLPDVDGGRTAEAWIAEARARDERNAEARGLAMRGLTDRIGDAWPVIEEHAIPTLLLLATEEPHVSQNRAHVARFAEAVPSAEVRWVDGAGHGLLEDVGAPLGDEIAAWLGARVAAAR
jgi:pimeloyl-ACP methyl ester carboxylesterase